ncbi:MAG TPA: hypothetical protein VGB55_06055, partial [Tepidisphaeraceae bacterium]
RPRVKKLKHVTTKDTEKKDMAGFHSCLLVRLVVLVFARGRDAHATLDGAQRRRGERAIRSYAEHFHIDVAAISWLRL